VLAFDVFSLAYVPPPEKHLTVRAVGTAMSN